MERYSVASVATIIIIIVLLVSSSSAAAANQLLSLNVSQPTTLKLSSGSVVEKSPGSGHGVIVVCERIHIQGLSRLHNLRKYAHSVKVKVKVVNPGAPLQNVEVCFHRNMSLGIGMCSQRQWEKLIQGYWVHSMCPYDNKLLDIRTPGPSLEILEVSIEEEFLLYRVIFLVLGIILLPMAPYLSKSIIFYYSGAMAVGVILVILMVLFQGMRLLPTGRKNSLAVVIYSSLVGVGSFILRYVPALLHSLLVEIGISDDLYTPLMMLLLVCIVLVGAWLGFWVVNKLVLTEDGSIDSSAALFVAWSIRIFSGSLIIQSSLDPLLATEALVSGLLVSSIVNRLSRSRLLHPRHKHAMKSNHRRTQTQYSSYEDEIYYETPSRGLSDSETYLSTFHDTPERKSFSKEEWEIFTRDSTKKALEELVSSPDFSRWAARNAERITLAPPEKIVLRGTGDGWHGFKQRMSRSTNTKSFTNDLH